MSSWWNKLCELKPSILHTLDSLLGGGSRSDSLHSVTRLAIYWTLDQFLKPLATINLPKSPTFLGTFCKGVKIYHLSSEIIFGQLL